MPVKNPRFYSYSYLYPVVCILASVRRVGSLCLALENPPRMQDSKGSEINSAVKYFHVAARSKSSELYNGGRWYQFYFRFRGQPNRALVRGCHD
jgi:hypothetical protein